MFLPMYPTVLNYYRSWPTTTHTISHSFAALTRELLCLPLEHARFLSNLTSVARYIQKRKTFLLT